MPTIQNTFAALIAATWKDCLNAMTSFVESESPHLLLLAWTQAVLTTAGIPSSEPAIATGHRTIRTALNAYENRAEQWAEARQAGEEALHLLLTQSETGFVGMTLHALVLRRERPPLYQQLQRIFLESLEHNLSKPISDLHLAKSTNLLFGASAGLTTLPRQLSAPLTQQLMDALWDLYDSAPPLDTYKILMSISLLQATRVVLDEQKRLNTRARLESPSLLPLDKICLLLSLLNLSELTSEAGLRIEIALLDQLRLLSLPSLPEESRVWLSSFLLPWLRAKISSDSLFEAWTRYVGDRLRRSKIFNYLFAYTFLVVGISYVLYRLFWATLIEIRADFITYILAGYITAWLEALLIPLDRIWKMYGREFQRWMAAVVIGILVPVVVIVISLRI